MMLQILNPFIKFIKWSAETEVEFIQKLDVGLMPIADDMWSRGKCAYKSLLYAACGIPVVMTPVGVNKKILAQSHIGYGPQTPWEWYDVLHEIFTNRTHGRQLGKNGANLVDREYSLNVCAPKLADILKRSV